MSDTVSFPDGFADALDAVGSQWGLLRSVDNTTRARLAHRLADLARSGAEPSSEDAGDAAWVLAEAAERFASRSPEHQRAALAWANALCAGVLVAPAWVTRVHGTGEPTHTPSL